MRMKLLGVAILAALAVVRPATAQEVVNYGVQPATMPIYIAREHWASSTRSRRSTR